MTAPDVDAIRARADAAAGDDAEGLTYDMRAAEWNVTCDKATAQMLLHAREDVPALLAEVERLRVERDQAREECGHEKHMRKFVSDERDDFIAAKMRAEAERDRLAATLDRVRALANNPDVVTVHMGGGNLVAQKKVIFPEYIRAAILKGATHDRPRPGC